MSSSGALDFNNHFINQIIFHSIQNDEFLKKVRHIVPLSIFKTKDKEYLIKIIFNYFDEYKVAPKDNFYDLFKELEKSIGNELYQRCMNLIGILKDITGSNPEYILRTVNTAIKHFRLEEASVDFALKIKRGKYDEAKALILKAMKEPAIEEQYYDFFKDKSFIENRVKENQYKMLTKIKKLDSMIGGLKEPWLVTILGATKGGKTWILIEMAVNAVLQGLNVLFVSLEMGKEQIDERFDMVMGFMTSKKNEPETEIMQKVGKKWKLVKRKVDSIYEINKVLKNRARIKKTTGGNLKIVASNRGRVNHFDIDRILDELEETDGFFADVVVVDYLGIMKETQDNQKKKERIGENCLGLKEMAGKRNIICITAMQGNRQAMRAAVFHSYMVADDIDTIFNSDLVLAMCQTEVEEKLNQYRIYVANYRHGKQHGSIGIIRDLTIGQVALDTFDIQIVKEETEEQPGVDY